MNFTRLVSFSSLTEQSGPVLAALVREHGLLGLTKLSHVSTTSEGHLLGSKRIHRRCVANYGYLDALSMSIKDISFVDYLWVIVKPIELQISTRPMLVSRDKVRSYDLSTPDHNTILLNLDVYPLHPPVIEP